MTRSLPAPFVDLLRLAQIDPVGHADLVIEAAHQAAAQTADQTIAGMDAEPTVAALAAEGPDASRSGLGRLISAVQSAHGVEPLEGIAAQDEAVAAMARRYLAGEVTPRELTYWVTRVVGLRGGVRTQVFLDLEQDYCARLGDADVTDLDTAVTAAADAFVHGGESDETAKPRGGRAKSGLSALFGRRRRS